MNLIDKQALAGIFERNLGNRLSMELANGMIQEVLKLLPEFEPVPESDNPTDNQPDTPTGN